MYPKVLVLDSDISSEQFVCVPQKLPPEQIIETVKQMKPDIVVLRISTFADCDVIRAIKAIEFPIKKEVAVIATFETDSNILRQNILSAGATRQIQMPVAPKTLRAHISKTWIDIQNARDATAHHTAAKFARG